MKWSEFAALLSGLGPETPLGRIVAIRAETDKEVLKHFTKDQRRIREKWWNRKAVEMKPEDMHAILEQFKADFIRLC